ncbi:hypothetical protein [Acinetobacter bereziniae]|uniref:hypothetical protein n=1 Tax=Acinetobacter bereziniae TaxID=106648 RepID=UPI00300898E2
MSKSWVAEAWMVGDMFDAIKKWFKRPIVININYEAVPYDTKLGVLTTPGAIDADQARMIREYWSNFNNDFKVVVLSDGVSLQALSDDALKEIGLKRIKETDNA